MSIASNLLLIANSTPCTHCVGWAWFSHSVTVKPICLATAVIAVAIFLVNGLALETGMVRIFFPFMQLRASNGSPGGLKVGRLECSAMTALAASRSGVAAREPPIDAKAAVAARQASTVLLIGMEPPSLLRCRHIAGAVVAG